MREGAKKKPQRRTGAHAKDILQRLSGGLSDAELQQVLVGAVMTLKGKDFDRLVARLGPETGGTLRKLMADRRRRPSSRAGVAGAGKVQQEWERAWDDWWARVDESTHEGGRYVVQEHHWEEPYLDTSALAEDLEPIAARLRTLIGRVIAEDLDADFSMAQALMETLQETGSGLPEWMGPPDEGIAFGPEVTSCLIEWESAAARRKGLGAYDLVRAIRAVENSAAGAGLDAGVVAGFIGQLDEGGQKAVLEGIDRDRNSEEWVPELSSAWSPWFRIRQDLCRRWNPHGYLETCRERLSQDWRLGLPVISEMCRRSDFEGALGIAQEAARSLLHLREGEAWDPLKSLYAGSAGSWFIEGGHADIGRLFKGWLRAAEALDRTELAWALKVQLVTHTKRNDWDAILDHFKRMPSPRFDELRERLFSQWTSWLAEQCVDVHGDDRAGLESGWVPGLARAVYGARDCAASFRGFLEQWLAEAERTAENLRRARPWAALVALDLDAEGRLRRTYPSLHRVLSAKTTGDRSMAASRRRWLVRCKAQALRPQVIAFWQRNVSRFVPDPANLNYDDCAAWLAAVEELDRDSFARLVAQWTATHRRRKNLWKALAERGLRTAR